MVENKTSWAVWIVGLPGCGKSTLARGVVSHFEEQGVDAVLLQMDKRRKEYFSSPTYSRQEREAAYRLFADEAALLVRDGQNVVMDGSAYKRSMRQYARRNIDQFAEIFVQCDLEAAMIRESNRPGGEVMAELYAKGLERQQGGRQFDGLGDVIGVDVAFEDDPNAECTIDNTHLSAGETLGKALHFLDTWLASD